MSKIKRIYEPASKEDGFRILTIHESHPVITLLYAAHDEQYNHALVLDAFFKRELGLGD